MTLSCLITWTAARTRPAARSPALRPAPRRGGGWRLDGRAGGQGRGFRMRYYNADGGEAEMCGNGARCFARFASRLTGRSRASSRSRHPRESLARYARRGCPALAMSDPRDLALDCKSAPGGSRHSRTRSIPGSLTRSCSSRTSIRPMSAGLGAAVRYQPVRPKGTNANFVQVTGPDFGIRTYERGV